MNMKAFFCQALMVAAVGLAGCSSVSPPSIAEADGPKRPVNVLTVEQKKILRTSDEDRGI